MASMPLAFSIHNFISSVGADAGFAAIIGLAVLVLLYFAHARETANLREEAALLTQRLMQAEARVAQLTRAQSSPPAQAARAPVAAAAARRVAAASPAVAGFPFAPAGVAAPALAAATRVVPLVVAPSAAVDAAPEIPREAPQTAPPAPEVPAPATPAAAASVKPRPAEHERAAAAPVAAPVVAPVAGANGHGHDDAVAAPPAARDTGLPPLPPRSRPGGSPGRGQLPPLREPSRSRSRLGRGVAALGGAALVAGVVVVLLVATSSGGSSSSSTTRVRTSNAPAPRKPRVAAAPFSPSSVTVAVLNGTNVNQLAHTVGSKLVSDGYKEGNLYTAANQSTPSTVVSYFPGAANKTAALHVATALNLKPSAVQPIDTTTQRVACPAGGTCANVVVTVGGDLSTL